MLVENSRIVVLKLGSLTVVDRKGKFKRKWVASLIKDISLFKFKKAKAITGNSVSQDFDVCFPAPRINSLEKLANLLEKLFSESLSEINNPPIKPPYFNDLAVQKYHKNSSGISPHRDHKKYTGVNIIDDLTKTIDESIKRHKDNHIAIIPEGPYVIPKY